MFFFVSWTESGSEITAIARSGSGSEKITLDVDVDSGLRHGHGDRHGRGHRNRNTMIIPPMIKCNGVTLPLRTVTRYFLL